MKMKEPLTRTARLREAAACSVRTAAALLVALTLFCLAASEARAAAPFADYRARVRQSIETVESMVYATDEEAEGEEADEDAPLFAKSIQRVRQILPEREQVESAGTTISVNNAWLHRQLEEYQQKAAQLSVAERSASLSRVAERLQALDARLAEAEAAAQQPPPARDKDAEKGRLANILRGKEYNRETAEGGALQRLFERIFEALNNLFPGIRPIRPGAGRGSPLVQYIVLFAALAVIFYVVWKYWWRRRRQEFRAVTPREARVVLGERIEADQTASDLLTEAEMLAREGDLRGAIRKAYVALLCELGDRKLIRLARHKTNRDYLRDARRDAPPRLYEEMRPLTEGFERHWYGLEQADQSDWADYRTRCRQALEKV